MLESIIEMLNKDPFVPFRIVLTSGEGFEISNPNLVALGKTQLTIYQPRSDRWAMLRLNQVASLAGLESAE